MKALNGTHELSICGCAINGAYTIADEPLFLVGACGIRTTLWKEVTSVIRSVQLLHDPLARDSTNSLLNTRDY